MGGEWNTGASLVAETWPNELRAKALAIVQSSWAIGYALAALVAGIVLRYANWRFVFFVGILPALVTLWMRRSVPESQMWLNQRNHDSGHEGLSYEEQGHEEQQRPLVDHRRESRASFSAIFRPPYGKSTIVLLLLNFFGLFAWWGLFTWIPPYLSPVSYTHLDVYKRQACVRARAAPGMQPSARPAFPKYRRPKDLQRESAA